MELAKQYAIRCSTEERARECKEKGLLAFVGFQGILYWIGKRYTIITYEEAKEKGLLGEKCNQDLVDATKYAVDMAMKGTESYSEPQQNKVNNTPINRRVIVDGKWRKITVTKDGLHYCDGKLELPKQEEPQQNEVQERIKVCKERGGHEIYSKLSESHGGMDTCFCRQCGKKGTRDELRLDFKESPSEDNLVEKIMRDLLDYKISDVQSDEEESVRETINILMDHLVRPVLKKHLSSK